MDAQFEQMAPAKHSAEPDIDPTESFHPFGRLPQELRDKIWSEFLGGTTPIFFTFDLIATDTFADYNPNLHYIWPVPPLEAEPHRYEALRDGSAAARTLSCVNWDARAAVLRRLPDTLDFSVLPPAYMALPEWERSVAEGKIRATLRFCAARDIIAIDAGVRNLWDYVRARGPVSVEDLSVVQHLALYAATLRPYDLPPRRRHWETTCPCGSDTCADNCEHDPLPKVLSYFPRLKTLHLVGATNCISASCDCVSRATGEPVNHHWPLFRRCGDGRDYLSWTEGICQDTSLPPIVKRNREKWTNFRFPHYKGLEHVEIRYLYEWNEWRAVYF